MTSSIDQVEEIITRQTCGFSDCTHLPAWKIESIRITTTDNGEVELAGYQNIPINRVCDWHKKRKKTHMLIANKAWLVVLRALEIENPGVTVGIEENMRLKSFVIMWKDISG